VNEGAGVVDDFNARLACKLLQQREG
jgi:hypothetical protein